MNSKLGKLFKSILFIGSMLMLAACATSNAGGKTGATMETEKPDSPAAQTTPAPPPEASKPVIPATTTKINPKEPFVNIRSAPSARSRILAVIKGGQLVEVLEVKNSWMKVTWRQGDVVKQGWLAKKFVIGYEKNR
jgi:uncharacterized protein YgiM (DUF1202 family)